MRLIDADKLPITNTYALVNSKDVKPNEISFAPLVCVLKADIDNAPTIEERPTGEWITRNGDIVFPFWERYECSVCHEYNGCSNFCPNCGADMRGDLWKITKS